MKVDWFVTFLEFIKLYERCGSVQNAIPLISLFKTWMILSVSSSSNRFFKITKVNTNRHVLIIASEKKNLNVGAKWFHIFLLEILQKKSTKFTTVTWSPIKFLETLLSWNHDTTIHIERKNKQRSTFCRNSHHLHWTCFRFYSCMIVA
jgi:hypothetical protein